MVSWPSGQWSPFIGSITREELKEWMTRHGRFLTRRQVAMMIDAVDINDDGEIDYSEFLVSLTTLKVYQTGGRRLTIDPTLELTQP